MRSRIPAAAPRARPRLRSAYAGKTLHHQARHRTQAPRHNQVAQASRGPAAARGRCYIGPAATLLFFDDFDLNRENLRHRIGQPGLLPEATFGDLKFWLTSGYPTAFRDATGI